MRILFVILQSAAVNASNLAIGGLVEWKFIHLNYCPCVAVDVAARYLPAGLKVIAAAPLEG